MKVVHVAFEVAPVYKTGGLGDVVGALPKYLEKQGVESLVVMPAYGWVRPIPYLPKSRVPVWYVQSSYFKKPNPTYDPKIQAPAFAHFALLVLDILQKHNWQPDIIHCHDWHAALIPWFLKKNPNAFFAKTKTVLTIHNALFQGNFPIKYLAEKATLPILEFINKKTEEISFLKLGLENADWVTTVSPNYAHEMLQKKGDFGLAPLINKRSSDFSGIINGIDYDVWNPRIDRLIPHQFDKEVVGGKMKNKYKLQKKQGLVIADRIPVFGLIARLTSQKGIDLLLPLIDEFVKMRMQLVILGSGDKEVEEQLIKYKKSVYQDWISVNLTFDEKLAHMIYAGADFMLIPSHFEPCGLTQMIAMSYGTIPIASNVGGLKDTIINGKTGFLFAKLNKSVLWETILKAHKLWQEQKTHDSMVQSTMGQNFSWQKSASEYMKLYSRLLPSNKS